MNAPARISGYQNAHQALCDRRLVVHVQRMQCADRTRAADAARRGTHLSPRHRVRLVPPGLRALLQREVFPATLKRTLAPYLTRRHLDLPEFGFRVNISLGADIAGID